MADNKSREVVVNVNGERTEYAADNLEDALAIENAPKIIRGEVGGKTIEVSHESTESWYNPDSPFHWTVQKDAHEMRKKVSDITVKVNVDVSEALTGLKALQREAREATKALRELEEASAVKSIADDIRRCYE